MKADHVALFHLAQVSVARMKAPMDQPICALWWWPAGQIPDVNEAKLRLEHLNEPAESATTFTFGRSFAPPVN